MYKILKIQNENYIFELVDECNTIENKVLDHHMYHNIFKCVILQNIIKIKKNIQTDCDGEKAENCLN